MDDYISKQVARDALMVAIDDVGILDGDDIKVVFDNLPSADVPHWIPCNERLPKECGRYLCTNNDPGEYKVDIDTWMGEENGWLYYDKTIAWMPLPKPWNEGEQHED